jgi:hypothetical protein
MVQHYVISIVIQPARSMRMRTEFLYISMNLYKRLWVHCSQGLYLFDGLSVLTMR